MVMAGSLANQPGGEVGLERATLAEGWRQQGRVVELGVLVGMHGVSSGGARAAERNRVPAGRWRPGRGRENPGWPGLLRAGRRNTSGLGLDGVEAAALHEEELVAQHVADGADLALEAVAAAQQAAAE